MRKWNDISIGVKYGVVFSVIIILFAISALISFTMLRNIEEEFAAYDRRSDRAVMIT